MIFDQEKEVTNLFLATPRAVALQGDENSNIPEVKLPTSGGSNC
jgi:hypothetical protein